MDLEVQAKSKVNTICTYGEAHIAVKRSMEMVAGNWVSIKMPEHKPQMCKEDAIKYYNAKLNEYWHTMLKDEIPSKKKREKIIRAICTNSIEYRRFCHKLKEVKNVK